MISFTEIRDSLLHMVFPHVCAACGSDLLNEKSMICLHCLEELPATNFHFHANNPIEKIFWGRLPVTAATAQYYFTPGSVLQRLVHELKYNGNRELGVQLGRMMGNYLLQSNRFAFLDALVPLPLYAAKEKKRGYNQAAIICEGISEVMKLPVWNDVVCRPEHTETQTKKGRIERWKNIEGRFRLQNPQRITNKHLLLIDDVITTGATLESCGRELLTGEGTRLSIATVCYTSR